jgi:hypothetical protein
MKTYNSKSIEGAIDSLQIFFESDMWSKFNPKVIIPGMKNGKKVNCAFYRRDVFKNEKDFLQYLEEHFKILRKEIRRLKK